MNTVILMAYMNGVWTDAGEAPVVVVEFDWPIIVGLIVSVVLPLLVGLVTKTVTDSRVKAFLLAGLSAATGLFTELGASLTAGEPYNLGMGLIFALGAFLVGVGMHTGIYKPTGMSAAAQRAFTSDRKAVG